MMIACSAGLFLTACATYEDDASYSTSTTETSSINEGSGAQQGWQSGAATRSQDYSSSQQSSGSQQLQSGDELIIPLHEEQVNVGKRTVDAGTVTLRKVVTTETVSQPVQLRKETLVIDREGGTQSSGAQFQGSASAGQSQRSASTTTTERQSSASIASEQQDVDADAEFSAQAGATGVQAQADADFDQAEPAGAQQRTTTSQNQRFSSSTSGNTGGSAFQEETYTIQLREEQPIVEKNVIQTGQVVARKNAQMQRQNVQREVRREDVQIDQGANARNVEIRGNFDSARGARGFSEPSGAQRQESSVERSSTTYQSETEIETQRDADRIGVEGDADFEDSQTLDDINQGSNTRGGAEDLQRFDEKATGGDQP